MSSTLQASCVLGSLGEDRIDSLTQNKLNQGTENWLLHVKGPQFNYTIKAHVFTPSAKVKSAASNQLVLFPTIDGEGLLERRLAKYFAKHNYWVVIPTIEEMDYSASENTTCLMDAMIRRVQESARLIFETLAQRAPNGKQMMVGASQGGIRAISAASTLPELHAVWANVAGGNFPSIYAYSSVNEIAQFRQRHMQELALLAPSEYQRYLRSELTLDPLALCPQRYGRLAMVVALKDESVPTANQLELQAACRPEYTRPLKSGHVRGVLDLWFKRKSVRQFLERP